MHASPQHSSIDSLDPTPRDSEEGDENKLQRSYRVPKPRIVRNDFRRFYPNMWVNVFNSVDRELMTQHLRTYYAPSVVVLQADLRYGQYFFIDFRQYSPNQSLFSQCTDREVHPQEIPLYQEEARGLDYLGAFWYAGMNAAPDLVCALRHTTLKVRSDGTSAIKCAFVLKGTMTATLDDQNQKDVERIARYQKHKESGRADIRDITFTEAAMVAVAPPAIVQVPGGKANLLHSGKSPNPSNTSALCPTALVSNLKNEPTLENSLASMGAVNTNFKLAPVTGKESLKRSEKSQSSMSCESLDGTGGKSPSVFVGSISSGASVTSVESVGTASTAATHRSQSSRKRAQAFEPSREPTSDSEEQFLRPVPRHQLAKLSSQPSSDSTSSGLASTSNHQPPRTALAKKARSVLEAAAKMQINWLSVAESAFDAGVLLPCQPQGAKLNQYYMCDKPVSAPSASALLAEHIHRTSTSVADSKESSTAMAEEKGSLTGIKLNATHVECHTSTGTNPNNNITTNDDVNHSVAPAVTPVGKKIVMTAKIDCVCSLELELNSNSVIVGIAVNYFR